MALLFFSLHFSYKGTMTIKIFHVLRWRHLSCFAQIFANCMSYAILIHLYIIPHQHSMLAIHLFYWEYQGGKNKRSEWMIISCHSHEKVNRNSEKIILRHKLSATHRIYNAFNYKIKYIVISHICHLTGDNEGKYT